jgi:hypothetical protein
MDQTSIPAGGALVDVDGVLNLKSGVADIAQSVLRIFHEATPQYSVHAVRRGVRQAFQFGSR